VSVLGRRIMEAWVVLVLASIPVFLIIHLAPGDPALMLLGVEAPKETVAAMRARLGLDQPLWWQYWTWVRGVATGNLGRSVMTDFTVGELLGRRVPATLLLAASATLLACAIALPLGILAAVKRGTWFDILVTALTSVVISVPAFWLGILLVIAFSLQLNWLPAGGYAALLETPRQTLRLLILPSVTLAAYVAAILARFIRTSLVEALGQDYVRTAQSKGLSPGRVILRHGLRNSLIPAVTVLGVQFGRLLAGTIIVEAIFAWPGLGQLMLGAINNRDYPVVQGAFIVFVVAVIASNLLTDLLYTLIDPRIRV
jgi:peptide/nickel transport system permease protein